MKAGKTLGRILALAALAGLAGLADGRERPNPAGPRFRYSGGTEKLDSLCEGNLELGSTELTFRCATGFITIPYDSIRLMQYRPNISRKVWKMKLKWKVRPAGDAPLLNTKRNRYFTIVYDEKGATQGLVLNVPPAAMRPYLAEIDLKAGKRVEVKEFEQYD